MRGMRTALYRLAAKLYHIVADFGYRTRIKVLIDGGLIIGQNVTIGRSVIIDNGYPFLIRIGDNCSICEEVHLLAHDATAYKFVGGHTRLGKVEIKDNCFIGEKVIVLPGVTIGPNALVAAGSVVIRDVPPNSCVAGQPARVYYKFDQMIEQHKQRVMEGTVLDIAEVSGNLALLSKEKKAEFWEAVRDKQPVYVRGTRGRSPTVWNPGPGDNVRTSKLIK